MKHANILFFFIDEMTGQKNKVDLNSIKTSIMSLKKRSVLSSECDLK